MSFLGIKVRKVALKALVTVPPERRKRVKTERRSWTDFVVKSIACLAKEILHGLLHQKRSESWN